MPVVAPITEGTILTTAAEQTIYEFLGIEPVQISLDMSLSIVGNTTLIKTYEKVLAAGTYVLLDTTTVDNVVTDADYQSILFTAPYGIKFTIQTTLGSGFNVPYNLVKVFA